MKKIVKLGVCGLAAVMLIAGCSNKAETAETAETTEVSKPATESGQKGSITLGEYKGVQVPVSAVEVSEEEVDNQIQEILSSTPAYDVITDRAAQDGDTVNIDYEGKKDGVAFEGGTAQGYDLVLGSGSLIPGFEEGLVGVKTGDKKSLNLKFPDDFGSEELAGAAVVFDVTINEIKVEKEAVLDDEFVKSVSSFKTVDEYRLDLKGQMLADKQDEAQNEKEYNVLMAVVNGSQITCAPEDVEEQLNQQIDYYTNMVSAYGMTIADYATMYGQTEEEFKAQLRTMSEEAVKQQMTVEAIAAAESFKLEDADRQLVADEYQMTIEAMNEQFGKENVDDTAMMYKVINFLVSNAKEVQAESEAVPTKSEDVAESSSAN